MCVSVNACIMIGLLSGVCVRFDAVINFKNHKYERLDIFEELPESEKQCKNRYYSGDGDVTSMHVSLVCSQSVVSLDLPRLTLPRAKDF